MLASSPRVSVSVSVSVTDHGSDSSSFVQECVAEKAANKIAGCSAIISDRTFVLLQDFYRQRLSPPFCIPKNASYAEKRDAILEAVLEKPRLQKLKKATLIYEVFRQRFACPAGNDWSQWYLTGSLFEHEAQ